MSWAEWSARATGDYRRLYRSIRLHDLEAAERVADRVVAKADWLAEFPMAGSPFGALLRKVGVPGTRYLILYQPRPNGIFVVRVFHENQDWHRS